MSDQSRTVSVKILDREFNVISPDNKADVLERCAFHLDKRMQEIRDAGRVVGVERIAVMAALNITQELLTIQDQHTEYTDSMNQRIRELQRKIDTVLKKSEPLELSV